MTKTKKEPTNTKPVKVKDVTTTKCHDAPGGPIKHINHPDGGRTTVGATRGGCWSKQIMYV